jgi:hypothetical protein
MFKALIAHRVQTWGRQVRKAFQKYFRNVHRSALRNLCLIWFSKPTRGLLGPPPILRKDGLF